MDFYGFSPGEAMLNRAFKQVMRRAKDAYMKRLDDPDNMTDSENELADQFEDWLDEYRSQLGRNKRNKRK